MFLRYRQFEWADPCSRDNWTTTVHVVESSMFMVSHIAMLFMHFLLIFLQLTLLFFLNRSQNTTELGFWLCLEGRSIYLLIPTILFFTQFSHRSIISHTAVLSQLRQHYRGLSCRCVITIFTRFRVLYRRVHPILLKSFGVFLFCRWRILISYAGVFHI